jgi:hypothetical protein
MLAGIRVGRIYLNRSLEVLGGLEQPPLERERAAEHVMRSWVVGAETDCFLRVRCGLRRLAMIGQGVR